MNEQKTLERLRYWVFEEKKWTKAEFARRMKIQAQHVNGYLEGKHDLENLYFYLQREGCDVTWLQTGEKRSNEAELLQKLKESGIDTTEKLDELLRLGEAAGDFMKSAQRLAKLQSK